MSTRKKKQRELTPSQTHDLWERPSREKSEEEREDDLVELIIEEVERALEIYKEKTDAPPKN